MTPLEYYREQCSQGSIVADPVQEAIVQQFEYLHADILKEYSSRNKLFSGLRHNKTVRGLYLWGKPGAGKTFMMDAFYQCLPFHNKLRMHFHEFMFWVHDELKIHQGKKNPLSLVAKDIAQKALVLCFDELTVSDITDAMLLGGLFGALFSLGVCLVTTSNVSPDELYRNGLQRERFMPTIGLLKKYTEVIHVQSVTDYRLHHLMQTGIFFTPLDAAAEAGMIKSFTALAGTASIRTDPVEVQGRSIPVIRRTETVVWFDFADICQVPRSQHDYLEIASRYKTVLISKIPAIPAEARDSICLFVSLVDVFYDARVRLVISAAEPVPDLYRRGFMVMEYARTHSRLMEMQSSGYFRSDD